MQADDGLRQNEKNITEDLPGVSAPASTNQADLMSAKTPPKNKSVSSDQVIATEKTKAPQLVSLDETQSGKANLDAEASNRFEQLLKDENLIDDEGEDHLRAFRKISAVRSKLNADESILENSFSQSVNPGDSESHASSGTPNEYDSNQKTKVDDAQNKPALKQEGNAATKNANTHSKNSTADKPAGTREQANAESKSTSAGAKKSADKILMDNTPPISFSKEESPENFEHYLNIYKSITKDSKNEDFEPNKKRNN